MKRFTPYLSLFKNKYLVSIVVFVVWISFFDRNDLFTQYDRKKELQKLEKSKEYYQEEIASTKKELRDLNNNPAVLEKLAREKFFLKRPNEEIFIVEDSSTIKKSEPVQ
jgi:cell division protein DivIC